MNVLRFFRKNPFKIISIRASSTVTIPALIDSYPLEATVFKPKLSSTNPTCVVISQATGTRRQMYFPFAKYLSEEHNLYVITYDYRGTNVRKRNEWELVKHWAQRDCAGVLSHALQNYNQVVHVGHSLGGNMHAILPSEINEKLSRILLVSSANSYLMYHKWNLIFLSTIFLSIIVPRPLNWLYGYYPMRTLFKTGVDMPSNIPYQWGRWSLHRECFVNENAQAIVEGFNSVKCPVLAINFADDEYYTPKAFDVFTEKFRHSSNVQTWHLPTGGHFNFFKEKHSFTLWNEAVRFIKHGDTKYPSLVNK